MHRASKDVDETRRKEVPEHDVECQPERLQAGGVHHQTASGCRRSITLAIERPWEAHDRSALDADANMKDQSPDREEHDEEPENRQLSLE